MKIQARTTFDRVQFDAESEVHLVLSLTAPAIDWQTQRSPLAIELAIDVSGSMAGDKLAYAQKSALKLVEHLKECDYVGIVTFESSVRNAFPPQKATPEVKAAIAKVINGLRPLGGTNLSGGMLESLEALRRLDLPVEYLSRVVLLTDGEANEGLATKPVEIVALLDKQVGRSTMSAFGYGKGANQNLLETMSTKGKGNYAFIENPDDALSAFAKELGGLLTTYGQDLVIEVTPHNGHRITQVVSDVEVDDKDVLGEVTLKVPNILAEETRHFVFAMKLSKQAQALPRQVNLADIKVSYRTLQQSGDIETKTEEAKARIRFVKAGEEQAKPTKEVDVLVAMAQMVRTQHEAEAKAKLGNYVEAQALMNNYATSVTSRGHDAISKTSGRLAASMSSPLRYREDFGYLRSVSNGVTRGVGVSSVSAEAAADLVSLECSFTTSSQDLLSSQFASGSVVATPAVWGATAAPVAVPAVPVVVSGDEAQGVVLGGTSLADMLSNLQVSLAPVVPDMPAGLASMKFLKPSK